MRARGLHISVLVTGMLALCVHVPAQIALDRNSGSTEGPKQSPYVPVDPQAEAFLNVEFNPELNQELPLGLEFMGDDGMRGALRDRMIEGKPAILALVYYRCPTMCNLVLNGMVDALKEVELTPGEDFAVLAVSFDSEETHVTARSKKANALEMYGDSDAEGWTFLVGDEPEIKQLTSAAGFGYKYDPSADQFSHGSGLLMLTPDGRISRFLPDVVYDPRDVRLALVEAGEGKVGSLKDKIALLCYNYDPETGKYGLLINRILFVACVLTAAAVAWLIFSLIRLERKANSKPASSST